MCRRNRSPASLCHSARPAGRDLRGRPRLDLARMLRRATTSLSSCCAFHVIEMLTHGGAGQHRPLGDLNHRRPSGTHPCDLPAFHCRDRARSTVYPTSSTRGFEKPRSLCCPTVWIGCGCERPRRSIHLTHPFATAEVVDRRELGRSVFAPPAKSVHTVIRPSAQSASCCMRGLNVNLGVVVDMHVHRGG